MRMIITWRWSFRSKHLVDMHVNGFGDNFICQFVFWRPPKFRKYKIQNNARSGNTYLTTCQPFHLTKYLTTFSTNQLPINISTYLPTLAPNQLPIYLHFHLTNYPTTYLPFHLTKYVTTNKYKNSLFVTK
jgi:hypothetical protein